MLIISGSDVSTILNLNKNLQPTDYNLYAANGTKVKSTAIVLLKSASVVKVLRLRRVFSWTFIFSDTKLSITGADFIFNYKLLIDIANPKLIDPLTSLSSFGTFSVDTSQSYSLVAPNVKLHNLFKEYERY